MGKAWNKNLESYADYSNRIGRGRIYVRSNMVIDLQINKNKINGLVQGTAASPYSVQILIDPLNRQIWQNILKECQGKIEELDELLEGKFPKLLAEIFTKQRTGLFPAPKEISFYCSCPDSAYMCKHVAAVLYGVGARLDIYPALFFELRDVNMSDLITEVIQSKTSELIKKASKKGKRVIDDKNLSVIFGIELETDKKKAQKKVSKKLKE